MTDGVKKIIFNVNFQPEELKPGNVGQDAFNEIENQDVKSLFEDNFYTTTSQSIDSLSDNNPWKILENSASSDNDITEEEIDELYNACGAEGIDKEEFKKGLYSFMAGIGYQLDEAQESEETSRVTIEEAVQEAVEDEITAQTEETSAVVVEEAVQEAVEDEIAAQSETSRVTIEEAVQEAVEDEIATQSETSRVTIEEAVQEAVEDEIAAQTEETSAVVVEEPEKETAALDVSQLEYGKLSEQYKDSLGFPRSSKKHENIGLELAKDENGNPILDEKGNILYSAKLTASSPYGHMNFVYPGVDFTTALKAFVKANEKDYKDTINKLGLNQENIDKLSEKAKADKLYSLMSTMRNSGKEVYYPIINDEINAGIKIAPAEATGETDTTPATTSDTSTTESDKEIAELNAEISELNAEIAELKAKLAALETKSTETGQTQPNATDGTPEETATAQLNEEEMLSLYQSMHRLGYNNSDIQSMLNQGMSTQQMLALQPKETVTEANAPETGQTQPDAPSSDKTEAQIQELLDKATAQAKTIIDDALAQAQTIIDNASAQAKKQLEDAAAVTETMANAAAKAEAAAKEAEEAAKKAEAAAEAAEVRKQEAEAATKAAEAAAEAAEVRKQEAEAATKAAEAELEAAKAEIAIYNGPYGKIYEALDHSDANLNKIYNELQKIGENNLPKEVTNKFVKALSERLRNNGYSNQQIQLIIASGESYKEMLERCK